jgi:hypothetical protein
MTEIPAETIRRAAKKMRAAAPAATPRRWDPVALAVADLLDAVARDADLGLEVTEVHGAALDAACVCLGESERTYIEWGSQ